MTNDIRKDPPDENEMISAQSIWEKLSEINVNNHVEHLVTPKKGKLTYLSWVWAWGTLMKHYPESYYVVDEPTIFADGSMMVNTRVVVKSGMFELERKMWLPVMDFNNKSVKNPNSVDINKAIMRCITKAISMFGLGSYIYAGEDLPENEKNSSNQNDDVIDDLMFALTQSANRGSETLKEHWIRLTIEEKKLVGEERKQWLKELALTKE